MIYKFLWTIRMWITGIVLMALVPVCLLWQVLVMIPIEWATDFEASRKAQEK
jgi:hypothetical protein